MIESARPPRRAEEETVPFRAGLGMELVRAGDEPREHEVKATLRRDLVPHFPSTE
jgi:hypothetical protein